MISLKIKAMIVVKMKIRKMIKLITDEQIMKNKF